MTTKLTLTMDDVVIRTAKKYAKNKGKSVSDILENYLKTLTYIEDKENEIAPSILKMMGVLKLEKDFDYKETLTAALVKKHKK